MERGITVLTAYGYTYHDTIAEGKQRHLGSNTVELVPSMHVLDV